MPDWLRDAAASGGELPFGVIVLRLAFAVAIGLVVAAVYHAAQRKPLREAFPFLMTLVLLTVLVAMTTLVIGNNVARAFSLVGALAIVRFRTIVEDTRDTAFVIFAVVSGMAIGAGHFAVCVAGVPAVAGVALLMGAWSRRAGDAAVAGDRPLLVRVGAGRAPEALLRELFARHLAAFRLTASATARQGAALDLRYSVRFRDPQRALAFVEELSRLEDVQHVELEGG